MKIDIERHPCFNAKSRHEHGRVHLPVAPKCNIQCNFCDRKYDCANETRPGVTSSVLTPRQALIYLDKMMELKPNISVVGIAGPGDPFANPAETMEALRLVREKYPEMILCLASNGFGIAPYIDELAELEVSHVTITMNAIDPEIAAKVYAWARENKTIYRGEQAGAELIERQLAAVKAIKEKGMIAKVNMILIPGVNDHHVEAVAKAVSELGADLFNLMPLYPVANTPFGEIDQPSPEMVHEIRAKAGVHMPQMHHCTRCRADAAGMLGEDNAKEIALCLQDARKASEDGRPYVAVASREGLLVNEHLGESEALWIFKQDGDDFEPLEKRMAPPRGLGDKRWLELARTISDCRALLVSGIGPKPRSILEQMGLRVVEMEGLIEDALVSVYDGQEIRSPKREFKCGQACSGGGMGCA
ncbi:MAG: nitrogenase cofactor biosynthesis protein NifB [Planctomycetes bacterium]|nr:nitrogenase cofactor biosynthesis protein NifB [Planctomycetota bacterium]